MRRLLALGAAVVGVILIVAGWANGRVPMTIIGVVVVVIALLRFTQFGGG